MIRFAMILLFFVPSLAFAADLTHTWKSPAFSGNGYSAHVLTIENQEFSRKKALKEKKEAAERQAVRDAANTNLSKLTIVSPDGTSTIITVPVGDFTF